MLSHGFSCLDSNVAEKRSKMQLTLQKDLDDIGNPSSISQLIIFGLQNCNGDQQDPTYLRHPTFGSLSP
jgi:hypothetical protein